MLNLELSETEAKLLAFILEEAGDNASCSSCNDFSIEEAGVPKSKTKELMRLLIDAGVADEEQLEDSILLDWQLIVYFKTRVEELLEK